MTAPHTSLVLSAWIQEQLTGLQFNVSLAERLALGCFAVVLDHHRSIGILASEGMHSSSFALLRPAFDALMRGYWFRDHATDRDIDNIKRAGDPPSTNKIVEMLENGGRVLPANFSERFHKPLWATLCDFTHTGVRQIVRQFSSDLIKPQYPDDEIRQTLWYADSYAYLAGATVAEIGKHDVIAQGILGRAAASADARLDY